MRNIYHTMFRFFNETGGKRKTCVYVSKHCCFPPRLAVFVQLNQTQSFALLLRFVGIYGLADCSLEQVIANALQPRDTQPLARLSSPLRSSI